MHILEGILEHVSNGISILGILIILWGAGVHFIELLGLERDRFRGMSICASREVLRHHLGSYLLLGLEFMIAADIIHTIIHPDPQSLIILGAIVVIRTIISYFLNKELACAHDCGGNKPAHE